MNEVEIKYIYDDILREHVNCQPDLYQTSQQSTRDVAHNAQVDWQRARSLAKRPLKDLNGETHGMVIVLECKKEVDDRHPVS